ncbi:MAG: YecA family protein [Rhizobacter sp.]
MSAPPRPPHAKAPAHINSPSATPLAAPLSEHDIDELQALLDRVPAPLEPLDVSMLDGYLCGLLVQPVRMPASRWLPFITDADGRALPANFNATRLHELAQRRHAELHDAISNRQWFDPWVFELDGDDDDAPADAEAVYPWVAGFATAMEHFPELMQRDAQALTEPLALLYRHLDPDDLEDADELLAEIDTLEPPEDLATAVEELVRATLLLADVGRPVPNSKAKPKPPPRRPGPPSRRRY